MTLDTRMGLNNPDEGLVGGGSLRRRQKGDLDEAIKVRLERRKMLMNIDRMTWYPNWRDLGDHFRPYRGRWTVSDAWDTNKGWRRNWSIVDSTPLIANNTLAAGMLAGTASPSRPWFKYGLDDEELMEAPGVTEWLDQVTKTNRSILNRSNYYNGLYECLGEYGVFGIMSLGREWGPKTQDEPDLPFFQPYTIGSYYIAQDKKRRVNAFFRDFRWTVSQIVEKFATGPLDEDSSWKNISRRTRGLWKQQQKDTWIDLVHAIEENPDYRPGALGWQGMRFRSVYYERGGEPDKTLKDNYRRSENEESEARKTLRVGGFRDFPVFVARWYTNSEDAWGRGPAMDALGDARALQLQQKRKAQAIDKHVDPPMVAHPSLRNQRTSMLSGDVTYVAAEGAGKVGFAPAYEIEPDIQGLLMDIKETQERIKSVMYADIFAMFIQAEQTGQPITAAEVNAKQQEKLLMLGPVLEQLNFDHFNPLHEWLYATGARHGLYPPPPPALQKAQLRVTYTSILAQAINAITASSIQQFTTYIGEVAQMSANGAQNPALDKVNFDRAIEEYGKATGIPPTIIRSDDEVAQVRQARQQQQEAQQRQEAAAQAAQNLQAHASAAQSLSQTPLSGGGSALDAVAQAVGAGQVAGR